jgi:hypothetical protein
MGSLMVETVQLSPWAAIPRGSIDNNSPRCHRPPHSPCSESTPGLKRNRGAMLNGLCKETVLWP